MRGPGWLDVIALAVSVVLWLSVNVRSIDTANQTQMQISVPISIKGQDKGLITYEQSSDQVKVTVRGQTHDVSALRENFFEASVNLSGELAHSVFPAVTVIGPPQVKIVAFHPETINIKQAPEISRLVPVRVKLTGQPAKGRTQGEIALQPSEVRVTGPEPLVQEIVEAKAQVHLSGQSESAVFELKDLGPVDQQGHLVGARLARLKFHPGSVLVNVPILAEARSVGVPISLANIRADQVDGWVPSIEIDPPYVTLSLAKEQQAPEFLVTQSERFPASTRVQSREVDLEIPDGFEVIGGHSVKVRVIPIRRASLPRAAPTLSPATPVAP